MQSSLATEGIATGGGETQLFVELIGSDREEAGYRYDVDAETQALDDRLVPNREKKTLRAKVTLIHDGKTIFGPRTVVASSFYDFVDPDAVGNVSFVTSTGQTRSVLTESLGQLDSLQGARSVGEKEAKRKLAERIARIVAAQKFD